jgi:aryl-alcohol dehydrogenase-like predicted oxidoreductase
MRYRSLGRSGLQVSEVCLGTMTFGIQADEAESFRIMDAAADAGVNFIDTADVYPVGTGPEMSGVTESIVGKWLRDKRDRFVLATKCTGAMGPGPNDRGSSRRHIIEAVDASLKRLQTDYIDLYQMHQVDETTPMDETLSTLNDLVRWGKIRYAGVSNYPAWRMALMLGMAEARCWERIVCDQPRYNMLYRDIESEIVPFCQDQGVGIIAYNPLAGGFLTGKHHKGENPEEGTRFALQGAGPTYRARYWHEVQFDVVEELKQFFAPRERSLPQVAASWVLNQPGITSAIVGASKVGQIQETLGAVDLHLDEDEMQICDEAWYKLPRPTDTARVQ